MLSDEQKEELQELAGLFFSDEEIMEILEKLELTGEERKQIKIGRMKSEAELRSAIMVQAKAGSSPAQGMAMKFLESFKNKNY